MNDLLVILILIILVSGFGYVISQIGSNFERLNDQVMREFSGLKDDLKNQLDPKALAARIDLSAVDPEELVARIEIRRRERAEARRAASQEIDRVFSAMAARRQLSPDQQAQEAEDSVKYWKSHRETLSGSAAMTVDEYERLGGIPAEAAQAARTRALAAQPIQADIKTSPDV